MMWNIADVFLEMMFLNNIKRNTTHYCLEYRMPSVKMLVGGLFLNKICNKTKFVIKILSYAMISATCTKKYYD